MFEGLLLFGLAVVAMGVCAGSATVAWQAVRGTAHLWQNARAMRRCTECRRLGRRCPDCAGELRRWATIALAVPLPQIAWLVMLWSDLPFSPRVRIVTAVWALVHFWLILAYLVRF